MKRLIIIMTSILWINQGIAQDDFEDDFTWLNIFSRSPQEIKAFEEAIPDNFTDRVKYMMASREIVMGGLFLGALIIGNYQNISSSPFEVIFNAFNQ